MSMAQNSVTHETVFYNVRGFLRTHGKKLLDNNAVPKIQKNANEQIASRKNALWGVPDEAQLVQGRQSALAE